MGAYQASVFVLFCTLTEVYSGVTDSIFMTMSSESPESQRVKRKEKDKTPLFCCCNFQWPLPATVISPEFVLMVSLVAFCCGVLTCFPPFENIWCGGSKQIGEEEKKKMRRKIREEKIWNSSWSSIAKTNKQTTSVFNGCGGLLERESAVSITSVR